MRYRVRITHNDTYYTKTVEADTYEIDSDRDLHLVNNGQATPVLTVGRKFWVSVERKDNDEV